MTTPAATAPAVTGPATARGLGAVTVGGTVNAPTTYSPHQIAAQPQVTVTTPSGRKVTGASLQALADLSDPQLDTRHNPILRQTVAVHGRLGSARFATGEVDPQFGNHPALLRVRGYRVDLVVPGDRAPLRTVLGVDRITVGRVNGQSAKPAPGKVHIRTPYGTRTITIAALRRLPEERHTVTFESSSGTQTHAERGPALTTVLLWLGVVPSLRATVTASASDDYGAAVTSGEPLVGRRPVLLSVTEDGSALTRPRLVTVGDLKGGRYVSDVTTVRISA